ncbi:hypothetical protein [Streptomyces sp. SID13031]|uniref:hypothetical protein n=1 Tax=Streptomyces sp. SID13031 TaxID=2706046 RepID=UPI0013C96523|nr:hypothetical protein [Streptomyces sp. SID13031]NEA36888.1 hypothetical protein [Streptomyces sp. SID13031]
MLTSDTTASDETANLDDQAPPIDPLIGNLGWWPIPGWCRTATVARPVAGARGHDHPDPFGPARVGETGKPTGQLGHLGMLMLSLR